VTLVDLLARYAYQQRPAGITLASGQAATEYVDCRAALGDPQMLHEISRDVCGKMELRWTDAIGGLAAGAIPIAVAVSMRTRAWWHPVRSFSVRGKRKVHGTCHMIEGAVNPGDTVCLVEDVVSTGESVLAAVLACQDYGLRVVRVLALVDREQGGLERIRDVVGPDAPVSALCTLGEIRACVQRGDHG
jgi:orotate phosphoribosyltransferase